MVWCSRLTLIKPILLLDCKAILRSPAIRSPWFAVKYPLDPKAKSIVISLQPQSLLSTVSKSTADKKESTHSISRNLKTPTKRKKRYYTEEEDELIFERVQQFGKDNPETWKSLAKEFNVKLPGNVKSRHDLLLRRGLGPLERITFTAEEDEIILKRGEEIEYNNIEPWQTLATEINRDPKYYWTIKRRYDVLISPYTKEIKRFTEEDDKFILNYVEKNGKSAKTWRWLAKRFKVHFHNSIRYRHMKLVKGDDMVKGAFTENEDSTILEYVKRYGNILKTFQILCNKLNRFAVGSIRERFQYLENVPSRKRGGWTLKDDQLIMESILQVYH